MDNTNRKPQSHGFTLIEVLVVVAIVAILVIIAIGALRGNRSKADDASVKAELVRLKTAFEDYYGDHNCYPPAEFFDEPSDCGSNNLTPYLNNLPCNPQTNEPYVVETDATGCSWFKIYADLKSSSTDPQALALCDDTGSTLGNYGISSDNVTLRVLCPENLASSPQPSSGNNTNPTPLPVGYNYYYCSGIGNCTSFDSNTYVCTPYFVDNPDCDGIGPNKCSTVGSCQQL